MKDQGRKQLSQGDAGFAPAPFGQDGQDGQDHAKTRAKRRLKPVWNGGNTARNAPRRLFFHPPFYPKGSDKYGGTLELPKGIRLKTPKPGGAFGEPTR